MILCDSGASDPSASGPCWTTEQDTVISAQSGLQKPAATTVEKCKTSCEKTHNCTAIAWRSVQMVYGPRCYIYVGRYGPIAREIGSDVLIYHCRAGNSSRDDTFDP